MFLSRFFIRALAYLSEALAGPPFESTFGPRIVLAPAPDLESLNYRFSPEAERAWPIWNAVERMPGVVWRGSGSAINYKILHVARAVLKAMLHGEYYEFMYFSRKSPKGTEVYEVPHVSKVLFRLPIVPNPEEGEEMHFVLVRIANYKLYILKPVTRNVGYERQSKSTSPKTWANAKPVRNRRTPTSRGK